ncbi:MAG: hypothetical protein CSB33_02995 [Desulfobacterales bacterium]|nr:MAG: hypothetical protein CSB33_02995 [Desulfobacterales bacterium]
MMTDRRMMLPLDLGFLALAAWLAAAAAAGMLSVRLAVPSAPPAASIVAGGATAPPAAPDAGKKQVNPLSAYDAIARRNLFHTPDPARETAPAAKPEPKPDITKLEHTRMRLKLWGTVSGDKAPAYAVIEDEKKRKQTLYREGDTIQTAMVKRISREQVILTVGGKDEILAMEKKQAGASRIGQVRPSSPFPPGEKKTLRTAGKRAIRLKRDTIDEAMSDVNSLMQQAKIRPHFTNGEADGLTLSRVRRDSIFTKLGLRSGDIITGVDGEDIRSVDDALKFYNNLKSAASLSLQIKRRGREEIIEYNID